MASRVRRLRNLGAIVSNEIVFAELRGFLERYFPDKGGGSVLDLGAGEKPYEPAYAPYFSSRTSADVPFSQHDVRSVDILAPADDLPVEDDTFDCIICTEVLEHCPDPEAVVREMFRVLRPGGRVYLTTPFQVPLHELPYDFFRYTPPALERLGTQAGFVDIEVRPKGDFVAVWLTVNQLPLTKVWQAAARITRLPLYSIWNPLVFATVAAPQLVYTFVWQRVRAAGPGRSLARRLSDKLSYYSLGFITTMSKPERT